MNKRSNLIKLAFKNIVSYKWINFKICFAFACLAFLVCLFTIYNQALTARRGEAFESAVSSNYVYLQGEPDEEQLELINAYFPNAVRYDFMYHSMESHVFNAQGIRSSNFMSNHLSIELSGELLTTEVDDVRASIFGGELFMPGDYVELKQRFGLSSMIIGSMPSSAEQAVLSEPLLAAFGLKAEDVLNKHVSLYVIGEQSPFYEGVVSGVLVSEYFELTGHITMYLMGIVLHEDHPIFMRDGTRFRYSYALDDWLDYNTTLILHDAGFRYAGSTLADWIDDLDKIQILANNLYYIIGTALIIGLVLTVCLMVGKYIRVFSRTSGILLTFGLEKRRLYGLLFFQLMLICIVAIPLAFALTISGYKVINALLMMMKDINMGVSFVRLIGMFGVGIFTVVAVAAIFFIYATTKLRGQTVKQFLNTEVR